VKKINVNLGKRSYGVYIGKGILKSGLLRKFGFFTSDTPVFVVTNSKINTLHADKLKKALKGLSGKILFYKIPDSEKAKSFPVYVKAMEKIAGFAKKAKPVVVAFGGGVVGDLAGMLASTYRRGVGLVHIPTTLLAQVDSSIGGKVAIDIKEAKNIAGNFYQPNAVICDLDFLKTLPESQMRNGLAEVIKYGIIRDNRFFSFLEKNIDKILRKNMAALKRIVYTSAAIKARVVEKDELDTKDLRAILNFGHTIGHAIEAASGYLKSIPHGEAVAAGMIMASGIAVKLYMLGKSDYRRITSLIKEACPHAARHKARPDKIMKALAYDKKFTSGVNRFVLPVKIGGVKIVDNVSLGLIKEAIKEGA
jgi:3-dehydroquinate synthase